MTEHNAWLTPEQRNPAYLGTSYYAEAIRSHAKLLDHAALCDDLLRDMAEALRELFSRYAIHGGYLDSDTTGAMAALDRFDALGKKDA